MAYHFNGVEKVSPYAETRPQAGSCRHASVRRLLFVFSNVMETGAHPVVPSTGGQCPTRVRPRSARPRGGVVPAQSARVVFASAVPVPGRFDCRHGLNQPPCRGAGNPQHPADRFDPRCRTVIVGERGHRLRRKLCGQVGADRLSPEAAPHPAELSHGENVLAPIAHRSERVAGGRPTPQPERCDLRQAKPPLDFTHTGDAAATIWVKRSPREHLLSVRARRGAGNGQRTTG
jgi:hypothetical protein